MVKRVSLIFAATPSRGIGKDGNLPWKLPADLKYFKEVTTRGGLNAVVMGTKTWDSIPSKFRPLPGRTNVVLSSTRTAADFPEGVLVAKSVADVVQMMEPRSEKEIFVIGGEAAFREAMTLPQLCGIYLTRVGKDFECDRFHDPIPEDFHPTRVSKTHSHDGVPFDFVVYERDPSGVRIDLQAKDHEEYQYLDLIRDLIENGDKMTDRTQVGTRSKFGCQMRFSLKESFPLLTTKRTFWRGVVEELLWFMKGDTNANHLSEKGVKIWDANGSRDFLDKRGLHNREEMDLGPVYGFQWRHFGAKYVDMHTDYTGQGVDQLAEVVHKLKTNPTDRRIIMSAWNPADLEEMALPPCHMFCQFYVANGELSCSLYQRSCDMGLGVPFNIASYALLTLLLAQVCDLKPGEFVHMMGNTHVYENHVEPLMGQLERTPRPFPLVRLNPDIKDIDGFTSADIELLHYHPHPKVAMEMAV
jgi:dihydrofolate reductase/thymidylate synthase